MDLVQLETFLKVAHLRNFTTASEILFVSQATVSTRIKALEDHLGSRLFERSSRRVELTPVGEQLVTYANQILTLADDARTAMRSREIKPFVRFGASPSSASYILPFLLGEFAMAVDDVEVLVDIDSVPNLMKRVAEGDLELALVEPCRAHSFGSLSALAADRVIIAAGADSAFGSIKEPLDLHALETLPLIMRTPNCCTLHFLRDVLNEATGRSDCAPNVTMWVNELETLKKMVREGAGLTVISEFAMIDELRSGEFVALPVQDIELVRQRYLAHGVTARVDPVVRQLRDFIESSSFRGALDPSNAAIGRASLVLA